MPFAHTCAITEYIRVVQSTELLRGGPYMMRSLLYLIGWTRGVNDDGDEPEDTLHIPSR